MPAEAIKKGNPKFPLRLMPSVRRTAEAFSEKEGVSLNQFINLAVAEKLAHLEHDEWVLSRKEPTKELVQDALELLAKARSKPVDPSDALPEGYIRPQTAVSKRRRA
jgi:hypothetical protein